MAKLLRVAVLGAGNMGCAVAGYLAQKGFTVNLFNRWREEIAAMQRVGGVQVEGSIEGFWKLNLITTEIDKAIKDVDVIISCVPAVGHRYMAEVCAPHLRDGQIVLINPGHAGGALEFAKVLKEAETKAKICLSETGSGILVSRKTGPAKVRLFLIKREVLLGVFPAKDTHRVANVAFKAFGGIFEIGENVLESTLSDFAGYIYHSPAFIFNFVNIERGIAWDRSLRNTPMTARFEELMDEERIKVADGLGVKVITYKDYWRRAYGATGENLTELVTGPGPAAPTGDPMHRFILEDIPYGAVPMVSLGNMLGVVMPATRSLIELSSVLYGIDFWNEGRTVRKMGLSGLSVDQIKQFVTEGY